jgi:hypothetical protein
VCQRRRRCASSHPATNASHDSRGTLFKRAMDVRYLILSKRFIGRMTMFALVVYSLQLVLMQIAPSDAVLRAVQIKSRRNPLCSPFFSTRKTSFVVSAKAEKKMLVTEGMLERQSETDLLNDATLNQSETMNYFKSEPYAKSKGKSDGADFEREISESTYSILEETPKEYPDNEVYANKSDENKPSGLAIVSKGKKTKVKEAKEVQKINDNSSASEESDSYVKNNDTAITDTEVGEVAVLLMCTYTETEAEEKTIKADKSKKKKEVIDEVLTEDISETPLLESTKQSDSISIKEAELLLVSEDADSVKASQMASDQKPIEMNDGLKVKDSKLAKMMEKIASIVDSTEPFAYKISSPSDNVEDVQLEEPLILQNSLNEVSNDVAVSESIEDKVVSPPVIKPRKTIENFSSAASGPVDSTDQDEEKAKVRMFGGEFWDPFMHENYPQDLDLLGDLKFDEKILQNSHMYYDDNSEGMKSLYEKEDEAVEEILGGGKSKSKSTRSTISPKSGVRSDSVSDKNMQLILMELEEKILSLADELYDEKRRSIQLIEAFLKMEVEQDLLRQEFQQYKQLVLEISANKEHAQ